MVYDTKIFTLCAGERAETRGTAWDALEKAKAYCESVLKYDRAQADDQPVWYDAFGVISNLTGLSGTRYATIYHLQVRS